jgi:TolB-like protein/Flp pilus assembly protein TadD
MYELLAGALPFKGSHQAAVMYEIVNVEPPPLSSLRPGVEHELERIVMKCLEKESGHRYQAVREVAVDLKRFRRDSDGKQIRPSAAAAPPGTARKSVRRLAVGIAVGVLVAAGALALFLLRGRSDTVESLAVLPFENASGDPNTEYLSDGITESIINSLTRISELRVVPRSTVFRFKGRTTDPQETGEKLNVHAVLTGRLVRQGEDLVAQVDLIDVRKQSQVWGQQYRRNAKDLLTLQDEITEGASRILRRGLSVDETRTVARRYTDNPEAYRAYLQGLYSWNKRRASEIEKAIAFFNQAIALDPTFALAYVGLANTYAIQEQYEGKPGKVTYPQAFAAASQALAIDSSLAEAHTTLAFASMGMWNWKRAEQEFAISISLNPKYPTTYHWYSILLHTLGRHEEAHRAIDRAQELDPLSPVIGLNVAEAFFQEAHYERALQEMRAVLAIDSSFSPAYYRQGRPYLQLGKPNEALAAVKKGVEVSGRSAESLSFLGYVLGRIGRKNEALEIARELEQRNAAATCPGYFIARVYAGADDRDRAIKWLDASVNDHSGAMLWLTHDPEWNVYRSDPRFVEILGKVGLRI